MLCGSSGVIALTCSYLIDCLQYAHWSEKIFCEMRDGGVDAVHRQLS